MDPLPICQEIAGGRDSGGCIAGTVPGHGGPRVVPSSLRCGALAHHGSAVPAHPRRWSRGLWPSGGPSGGPGLGPRARPGRGRRAGRSCGSAPSGPGDRRVQLRGSEPVLGVGEDQLPRVRGADRQGRRHARRRALIGQHLRTRAALLTEVDLVQQVGARPSLRTASRRRRPAV